MKPLHTQKGGTWHKEVFIFPESAKRESESDRKQVAGLQLGTVTPSQAALMSFPSRCPVQASFHTVPGTIFSTFEVVG